MMSIKSNFYKTCIFFALLFSVSQLVFANGVSNAQRVAEDNVRAAHLNMKGSVSLLIDQQITRNLVELANIDTNALGISTLSIPQASPLPRGLELIDFSKSENVDDQIEVMLKDEMAALEALALSEELKILKDKFEFLVKQYSLLNHYENAQTFESLEIISKKYDYNNILEQNFQNLNAMCQLGYGSLVGSTPPPAPQINVNSKIEINVSFKSEDRTEKGPIPTHDISVSGGDIKTHTATVQQGNTEKVLNAGADAAIAAGGSVGVVHPVGWAILGVGLTVKAFLHVSSLEKANKIQQENADAQGFQFMNWPTDKDFENEYKSECQKKIDIVRNITEFAKGLISHHEARQKWKQEAEISKDKILAIQTQLQDPINRKFVTINDQLFFIQNKIGNQLVSLFDDSTNPQERINFYHNFFDLLDYNRKYLKEDIKRTLLRIKEIQHKTRRMNIPIETVGINSLN